jgi:hypothetical protein
LASGSARSRDASQSVAIGHALGGRSLRLNARPSPPFRLAGLWVSNIRSMGSVLEIDVYKNGSQPQSALAIRLLPSCVRSWEGAEQKRLYMKMNPVRAGLVASPEDWPFQGEIFRHYEWW